MSLYATDEQGRHVERQIDDAVPGGEILLVQDVRRVEEGFEFRDGGFTDKEKASAIATLVQAGVEERAILSI